jgi:hypothetical protein
MINWIKLSLEDLLYNKPYSEFSEDTISNKCLLKCIKSGTIIIADTPSRSFSIEIKSKVPDNKFFILDKKFKLKPIQDFIRNNKVVLPKLTNPDITNNLEKALLNFKNPDIERLPDIYDKVFKLGNKTLKYGSIFTIQMFVHKPNSNFLQDINSNIILDIEYVI